MTAQKSKVLLVVRMASSAQNVESQISESSPKVQKMQFYRRPLPASCVAFASEEGKRIFTEALSTGHMDCFFKLCSQYRTQDEPAYCGLTSLVMALNVLEIDPGRIWKGPWRWYHEEMLDCCTPLQVAREKGINMEQFTCLARCNNLTAVSRSAADITSVDELRTQIKIATQREDVVFVASYSRKILGQTGDGHFSPIAGYNEKRDMALILDTARFKYPPHWVPVKLLLDAMRPADPDTGRPRGYILLSSAGNQPGLLLFRPSCFFAVDSRKGGLNVHLCDFAKEWGQWLSSKMKIPEDRKSIVHQALTFMLKMKTQGQFLISMFCFTLPFVRTKDRDGAYLIECPKSDEGLKEVTCAIRNLITELEALDTFKAVQEYLTTRTSEEKGKFLNLIQGGDSCVKKHQPEDKTSTCCNTNCCNKPSRQSGNHTDTKYARLDTGGSDDCATCDGTLRVGPEHAATLFLSAWPHALTVSSNSPILDLGKGADGSALLSPVPCSNEKANVADSLATGTVGRLLTDFISLDINRTGFHYVTEEISTIKFKLREVIKCHSLINPSFCCGST